jgi:hypothetical protein
MKGQIAARQACLPYLNWQRGKPGPTLQRRRRLHSTEPSVAVLRLTRLSG